jgi:hypothetical protein
MNNYDEIEHFTDQSLFPVPNQRRICDMNP